MRATRTECRRPASAASAPRSLHAHFAGVQAPPLGVPVHPSEVLEARGAAKPGLPEVHVAGEEEVPGPRPHAALQQRADASPPAAALALGGRPEHPALLPVDPAHAQVDGRLLPLGFVGDVLDGASHNCGGKETVSEVSRVPTEWTARVRAGSGRGGGEPTLALRPETVAEGHGARTRQPRPRQTREKCCFGSSGQGK